MERLRLAGAQINPVVGDVDGNVERILAAYRQAAEQHAHLVVFPELAVTGYPPEDLVFKPSFLAASRAAVERVAAEIGDTAAAVGFVEPTHAGPADAAATICEDLWFPWGPVASAAAAGAEVVVSLNASPYRMEKADRLIPMLATRAADHGVHVFYVHMVGGQDEL